MQLRHHPEMRGRWPPKQALSGSYDKSDPLPIRPALPDAAVLRHVLDCPPFPSSQAAQGVILYTDQGTAVILTTHASFRAQLFQTLSASCGLSLQEIGDLAIDF